MLYSIDSGKYATVLPHKKDYEKWRNYLFKILPCILPTVVSSICLLEKL